MSCQIYQNGGGPYKCRDLPPTVNNRNEFQSLAAFLTASSGFTFKLRASALHWQIGDFHQQTMYSVYSRLRYHL